MKKTLLLPLALLLSLPGPAGAADGPDELWEMTSAMTDKASGFAMPASTMRLCLKKGASAKAEEVVPVEKDCRLLDTRTSGSTTRFRFECTGRTRMTGSGELDRPNASAYSGRMQMNGAAEGRKIDMAMSYSGKRVGGCTFSERQAPVMVGGPGKGAMPPGMSPETMERMKADPAAMDAMKKMFGR